MSSISNAIASLQANWHSLLQFERAIAVLPIVRAGVSRRSLAIALHVSEGTLRNLLFILNADLDDLAFFRAGEMSQNELLRRVRGNSPRRTDRNPELQQNLPAQTPSAAAKKYPTWWTPLPMLPLIRRASWQSR